MKKALDVIGPTLPRELSQQDQARWFQAQAESGEPGRVPMFPLGTAVKFSDRHRYGERTAVIVSNVEDEGAGYLGTVKVSFLDTGQDVVTHIWDLVPASGQWPEPQAQPALDRLKEEGIIEGANKLMKNYHNDVPPDLADLVDLTQDDEMGLDADIDEDDSADAFVTDPLGLGSSPRSTEFAKTVNDRVMNRVLAQELLGDLAPLLDPDEMFELPGDVASGAAGMAALLDRQHRAELIGDGDDRLAKSDARDRRIVEWGRTELVQKAAAAVRGDDDLDIASRLLIAAADGDVREFRRIIRREVLAGVT